MSFKNCKIVGAGVNSDKYHSNKAERGSANYVMSPSSIKAFSGNSHRWKEGYEPPDSEAKDFGNLIDCLALTPNQFKTRYAIKPATYIPEPPIKKPKGYEAEEKPWNGNSSVCRQWLADHAGVSVVSNNDITEAQTAVRRLTEDSTIAAFLRASETQVHVVGEWHDKATGLVIPVQCLIDCVPGKDSEFQKSIGDLKTTRNAGQRPFARWCHQAGYHVQGAFDLAMYCAATGEDRTDWIFLLVENYPPYETGRRLLSQDFLDIGRQTYEHALARYARCLKTGIWTGYDPDDEFSIVAPEPYMQFEAMSDAMESEQTETAQESNDVAH